MVDDRDGRWDVENMADKSYEIDEDTGPATNYQELYQDLRKLARPQDLEVIDLVLNSGMRQADVAAHLGITQAAVSHRFATAQYNLLQLSKMPSRAGVRATLHRYMPEMGFGRNLALAMWVFCVTTCEVHTAKIMAKRRDKRFENSTQREWWKRCNQVRLRYRITRAIKFLEDKHTDECTKAMEYLKWHTEHLYLKYWLFVPQCMPTLKRKRGKSPRAHKLWP